MPPRAQPGPTRRATSIERDFLRVLELMREVRRRVAEGDQAVGQRLAAELGPWFEHHAATMDTIVAEIGAGFGRAVDLV